MKKQGKKKRDVQEQVKYWEEKKFSNKDLRVCAVLLLI